MALLFDRGSGYFATFLSVLIADLLWIEPVGSLRIDAMADLFAFLTCDPNADVAPIHPEAMPVILRTREEIDCSPTRLRPETISKVVPKHMLLQWELLGSPSPAQCTGTIPIVIVSS